MFLFKNVKNRQFVRILSAFDRCSLTVASLSSNAPETQNESVANILGSDTYGQPTAWSHPHIVNAGELVTGVCLEEFQLRRIKLMAGIQKFARENLKHERDNVNNIVIIPSSSKKYMSDKIPYVFRQNSDFFYLTGCLEPDTVLVMSIDEKVNIKSTLFMRPKDKHAELWDGARTGVDNALELFGVDETYASDQFQTELQRQFDHKKWRLWYDSTHSDLPRVSEDVRSIKGAAALLNPPAHFVQSMRLFKSPAEQELLRRSCQIASESINEVMRETRPGHSEHHINAMVDYKCRMRNASYLAYPPVVAAGSNATTIHYINNTQLTKSGDLVLMDAGCEYGGYTSDITRTWPVNGSFTEPQKVIYEVVHQVQTELIDTLLQEGGETLDQLFETMCQKLGKYLQEVGLVSKSLTNDKDLAQAGYKFCPHHVSHYLGMDVHDTPLMPRTLRLVPGMVCTVEPGIYIASDNLEVPKEFRGIGIRIEDDVLITDNNTVEVLTASCIKERNVLENLFKEKTIFKFKP